MVTEEEILADEKQIRQLQLANTHQQTVQLLDNQNQQQGDGMFFEQMDLSPVFELIDHLLEGEVLVMNPETKQREWKAPEDENMILLSPEGINFVRKRMSWHINKNTLLSNYDEDQISTIVKEFSISLQDALFLKSSQFFRQPSLDRCKEILKEKVSRKADIKAFTRELLNLPSNKKEIEEQLLKEMEGKVEKELESIRASLIKNREKEFESLIIDLEFLVWSTYNRALRGEERGSLRRHQQSLEVKGGGIMQGDNSGVKPGLISTMFKGK